ncbi:MAG: UvrD-helicase domain-containing protein [Myxococcales bacterium]|nr:UvrD-helicase domain-containing protein [Myxococcales bacterium]
MESDVERFERGLNPAQREAVVHGAGPMLVLAGAGSGKTRVITFRIARLLALGVPPSAILAVTFTNKAAEEMHERIVSIVGPKPAQGLTVCTFHAFGLSLLQREKRYLGFGGGFAIFDQSDALGTIREIMRGMNIYDGRGKPSGGDTSSTRRLDAGAVASRISLAKNAFETGETMPDGGDLEGEAALYQQVAKLVYPKYVSALRGFHALDFDDLICEPVRLLGSFPEVRERWQRKFRYILVDEYQDTNKAQLEFLRLVVGEAPNLTVVGDDDQSIYGWRGADVRNILSFDEHFPGAKIVKLEQNYRSRQPVLEAANAVIAAMPAKKFKKSLFTERAGGDMLQLVTCALPEVEASFVGAEIERLIREGRNAAEISVMYRSNSQAAAIEEALRERSIAYTMIGGQAFFDRKEVKDLLSYLRLAVHPNDEIALRRIINYPTRGIGETALSRLEAWAISKDQPLLRAVQRASDIEGLSSSARAGCAALAEALAEARTSLSAGKPASAVARHLAESIKLKDDLTAGAPTGTAAEKRWANVENLFRSFDRWQKRVEETAWDATAARTPGFAELLHRLTLRFADEEEAAGATVTLTTLHGAKGLEYEVVFLIGLEEGILPHKRSVNPNANEVVEFRTDDETGVASVVDDAIDEERRLFYVGVTRAKERLYLCRARARSIRGQPQPRTPSRFLADVPRELCEMRDVEEVQRLSTAVIREKTAKAIANLPSRPKF